MNCRPKKFQTLSQCHFIEKDDLVYLQDDTVWIESRAKRLKVEEKRELSELIHRLHQMDLRNLDQKYYHHVWKHSFKKGDHESCKRQNLVRNIFLAAVVREVILRTETAERMAANRASFLDEFEFLQSEEGTDEELTWLVRYTRALKILAAIYQKGKKTLMMGVAAHLQGSSVYTEYTTGGANKPETARRVRLHEMVTGYSPKKRPARHGKKGNICVVTVKRGRGRPRKVGISNPVSSLEMSNEMLNSDSDSDSDTEGNSIIPYHTEDLVAGWKDEESGYSWSVVSSGSFADEDESFEDPFAVDSDQEAGTYDLLKAGNSNTTDLTCETEWEMMILELLCDPISP